MQRISIYPTNIDTEKLKEQAEKDGLSISRAGNLLLKAYAEGKISINPPQIKSIEAKAA